MRTVMITGRWCALPVLAVGASVLGTCGTESAHVVQTAAHASPNEVVGTRIIDASVGETFTPAVSTKRPGLLSPDLAYGRAVSKGKHMPTGTAYQLGYLTLPLGAGAPGQFTAHNALVYAFTWPECGPRIVPVPMPRASPTPTPTAASTDCTRWEFVDARTGDMIDMTWTQ
jgi:hypothetical protein